jgi:hypothetical protein
MSVVDLMSDFDFLGVTLRQGISTTNRTAVLFLSQAGGSLPLRFMPRVWAVRGTIPEAPYICIDGSVPLQR